MPLYPANTGGLSFDVGVAVPTGDVRALMWVDGNGAVATARSEDGIGATGVFLGRFKYAEHASDNCFLGHGAVNTSSVTYQLFFGPTGNTFLKAPGAAKTLQLIAGDSGGSEGQCLVNASTQRFRWNNTGIGFFTAAPVAQQNITGSRGGNAALADLLTKLALTGLITDGTSA